MKKGVESQKKQQHMGVIFNKQNFHLFFFSLPTKEFLKVHDKNRLVANLPFVDFLPQPREMPSPKPLIT